MVWHVFAERSTAVHVVTTELGITAHSGAQVMSLVNSDENKTFGIVLRTPVENSKGIPHILEHSVLCGSRKYPIKEPFVELMKVLTRRLAVQNPLTMHLGFSSAMAF